MNAIQEIIMTIEDMIGTIYVANHAIVTKKEETLFQRVLSAAHNNKETERLLAIKNDVLTIAQSFMDICDLLPFVDPEMWDRVKQVKEFCGDFSMKPATEY